MNLTFPDWRSLYHKWTPSALAVMSLSLALVPLSQVKADCPDRNRGPCLGWFEGEAVASQPIALPFTDFFNGVSTVSAKDQADDAAFNLVVEYGDALTLLTESGSGSYYVVQYATKHYEIHSIANLSKGCDPINGRADPDSPDNDPGDATEDPPVDQPAQCTSCGSAPTPNDGSTPPPPYQYNLDIGAGRSPGSDGGAPLGRVRYMHNFANDGQISLDPAKFTWDSFGYQETVPPPTSLFAGGSPALSSITTLQSKFQFTWNLNSAGNAVDSVQIDVTPVAGQSFQSHTLVFSMVAHGDGEPDLDPGVQVVDTNNATGVSRISREFGTHDPASVTWYSQAFDGTITSGTSYVDAATNRRHSFVTTTTAPALGAVTTSITQVFDLNGTVPRLLEKDVAAMNGTVPETHSTYYSYYADDNTSNANLLQSTIFPDGSWVLYGNYDAAGHAQRIVRPSVNGPSAPAHDDPIAFGSFLGLLDSAAGCLLEIASYQSITDGAVYDSSGNQITNVILPGQTSEVHDFYRDGIHIGGSLKNRFYTGKTSVSNFPSQTSTGNLDDYMWVESDRRYDPFSQQWQGSWKYSSLSKTGDASISETGLPPTVRFDSRVMPDGRLIYDEYGPVPTSGPYTSAASYYQERTYPPDPNNPAGLLTTALPEGANVWLNANGDEIARQTTVNGTVIETVETTYVGRQATLVTRNGFITSQVISGPTLNSTANPPGLETDVQDGEGNVTKTVVDPNSGVTLSVERSNINTPNQSVKTVYANSGNTQTQVTSAYTSGVLTLQQTQTTVLDGWGRPTTVTGVDGGVTSYSYSSDGLTVTKTAPNGATTVTQLALDGHLLSITGTGQAAETHSYDIYDYLGAGTCYGERDTVTYGDPGSARVRSTVRNTFGQTVAESRPAPPQLGGGQPGTITRITTYDAAGRPVQEDQTGMPTRLHEYLYSTDLSQTIVHDALDLPDANGNGTNLTIDLAGPDAVTETVSSTQFALGSAWWVTTTNIYGAGSNGETRTTSVWTLLGGGGLSTSKSVEADGTQQVTSRQVQSAAGTVLGMSFMAKDAVVTESSSVGGNSVLRKTSIYRAGQLISEATSTPATGVISYTYDGLGRRTALSGAGRSEAWTYDTSTGWMLSHTMGSGSGAYLTTYTYGMVAQQADWGSINSVTTPSGVTYGAYNSQGQVTNQWGSATTPSAYGYDAGTGKLVTLKTYQNSMADWASGTPWSSPASSTTTWAYDSASGALLSKTDGAGQPVQYLYDGSGRVAQRTSARGITTTYAYDGAGHLSALNYSDSTPSVSIKYTRAGEIAEQTDATGHHVLTLDGTGQNVTDTLDATAGEWQGLSFVRSRSTVNTSGNYRAESLSIQSSGTPLYDTSRLQIVGGPFQSVTGLGIVTRYSYGSNGQLSGSTVAADDITGGAYPSVSTGAAATRTLGYDGQNRLSTISYGGDIAGWTYGFDAAWRRSGVTPANSGRLGWSYTYTSEGAVSTADRVLGTNAVDRQHWEYQYDAIGNRTQAVKGAATTSYALPSGSARDGTQYASIGHPSLVDIGGMVTSTIGTPAAASVTMDGAASTNGTSTSNLGESGSYYREFDLASTGSISQARWVRMQVNTGSGASTASRQGWYFYRGSGEAVTYDLDGNLTSDARWTYVWDAENRLLAMYEKDVAGPSGATPPAKQKLEFVYDANGRRAAKRVYQWSGTDWQPRSHLVFLYDGWNLVAELDALNSNRVRRRYVWGPDLSGSMAYAGGVGGLLLVEDEADMATVTHRGVRYQVQNDGNGNVMGLVALDGNHAGLLAGRFDYDAFGNRVTNTLPGGLEACPIGFSSKYEDKETKLLYYGFRYYSPEMGRWTSRDPIAEQGGLNLYQACYNNLLNLIDPLGETSSDKYHCCDKPKREEGRKKLQESFDKSKEYLDGGGLAKDEGVSKSCANWNNYVNTHMPTMVPCWECSLQHGSYNPANVWKYLQSGYSDHWVVMCSSADEKGRVVDKIIFDATGGYTDQAAFDKFYPKREDDSQTPQSQYPCTQTPTPTAPTPTMPK